MKNSFISISQNVILISACVFAVGIAQLSLVNLVQAQEASTTIQSDTASGTFGGIGSGDATSGIVSTSTVNSGGIGGIDASTTGNSGGISGGDATSTGNSGGIGGVDATSTGNSGGISGSDNGYQTANTIPPTISSVSNVSATSSDGSGVVVNFTIPTATSSTGVAITPVCNPVSGSTFSVGTTPVTCTATDTSGNSASTTFDVIVAGASTSPTTPTTSGGGGSTSYGGSGSFSSGGSSIVPLALASGATTTMNYCPLLTSYLKLGANNDSSQVSKLQAFLKSSQGLNVTVNGIFDLQTENAVKDFQSKFLSQIMGPWGATQPSGKVYITTEKKINELACNTPLTLSLADLAIINAYKNQQNQAGVTGSATVGPVAPGTSASPSIPNNSGTTTLNPDIGQNNTGASANTATVVNAPIISKIFSGIGSFFKNILHL